MSFVLFKMFVHSPLLGMALGPIVMLLGDYIHSGWSWLDNQPAFVKQLAAVALSMLLVGLTQLIPGVVPQECVNVAAQGISTACENALASGPFLQTVLSTLTAIAVKHGMQKDAKAAAIVAAPSPAPLSTGN